MLKVFVYGTLKPGEFNYPNYCASQIVQKQRAYTWGQLFNLPLGYPALTPGNRRVDGFLLTFAQEAVLARLDELEDYQPQRSPLENEYYRRKIWVYDLSGQPLDKAWGYFMTLDKIQQLGGFLLPSGWWTGITARKLIVDC